MKTLRLYTPVRGHISVIPYDVAIPYMVVPPRYKHKFFPFRKAIGVGDISHKGSLHLDTSLMVPYGGSTAKRRSVT